MCRNFHRTLGGLLALRLRNLLSSNNGLDWPEALVEGSCVAIMVARIAALASLALTALALRTPPPTPPIAAYMCSPAGSCGGYSCVPLHPNETKRCNPAASQPWRGKCFNTSEQCEGDCYAPDTPPPAPTMICDPVSETCSTNCTNMWTPPKAGVPACTLNPCSTPGCQAPGDKC